MLAVAGRLLTYEWESVKWRADLRRLSERLRDPERTDALTGLLNRVAFVEAVRARVATRRTWDARDLRARASGSPTSVASPSGTAAAVAELMLKDAADVMETAIRRTDHAGRTRRGRVRRGARGLQGTRGRGRVHRPLRPVAHARDAGAAGAARDRRTRSARSATPSRRRRRLLASRPRPAAARSRSPGRPRERRGEHRLAAAAEGHRPALGAGRPLGLPERCDRGAGLRHGGGGRGGRSRGAQRQHGRAGARRERGDHRGAARARDRRALRPRLHRSGRLRGRPRRGRDDPAFRRQALPGRAGRVRRRGPAGRDDGPGGLARGQRHRRDDEARRCTPAATTRSALEALLVELAASAEDDGGRGAREVAGHRRRCSGRRARRTPRAPATARPLPAEPAPAAAQTPRRAPSGMRGRARRAAPQAGGSGDRAREGPHAELDATHRRAEPPARPPAAASAEQTPARRPDRRPRGRRRARWPRSRQLRAQVAATGERR